MALLQDAPTVVLGDLNANPESPSARGAAHFRRLLAAGWRRANPPDGASYYGPGRRHTEVDHMLCDSRSTFAHARYVTEIGGWRLAGHEDALSDHAALLADLNIG